MPYRLLTRVPQNEESRGGDVGSQNLSKPFISRAFHVNVHCKYCRCVSGAQIVFVMCLNMELFLSSSVSTELNLGNYY